MSFLTTNENSREQMKINLKKTSQAATLFAAIVFGAQAQVHPEEAFAVTPFQIQKLDVSSGFVA